jgi:bifunctional UDP-N-acetylglucosamine pyrophosphorylase/glucosamine-1-phosphate N-acetyltransferase
MKAVIPVAGNGTRLFPLTLTKPKALMRILNKPLIKWTIDELTKQGITGVILVISPNENGKMIREYIASEDWGDVEVEFAVQDEQLGTGHSLQMAKDFFSDDEEFVFFYGDDMYGPKNIERVVKSEGLAVVGKSVDDPEKWGILKKDEEGHLDMIFEKPKSNVGNLGNIGAYKLHSEIFDLFSEIQRSPRGEYEITDTINLLAKKHEIKVFEAEDYWMPIGYPWHVLEATEYFLQDLESKIEGEVEDNVTIKGNLVLPKSSRIQAGAYIDGNVLIGENTLIGPGTFIRKNTVIGDNCLIGFSNEIKNSVIGNGTTINHLSFVGDSVIGDDVHIAGQFITANFDNEKETVQTLVKGKPTDTGREKFGAVLGDGVRLDVATKIYPGRKIWPGKITKPGEIVDYDLMD